MHPEKESFVEPSADCVDHVYDPELRRFNGMDVIVYLVCRQCLHEQGPFKH